MLSARNAGPVHLAGGTVYFPGPTNSGLKNDILIDTVTDISVLDNLEIKEVLITHGHADHFRCAAALRQRGARVWAAREEAAMVENPEINIRGMFSWALPSEDMVTRLFRGEGSVVDGYLDRFQSSCVECISMPGHTLAHVGFYTEDGVLFAGDAFYIEEVLDRFPLPYAIDIGLVKKTLMKIDAMNFKWLVPSHGKPLRKEETDGHVRRQIEQINKVEGIIMECLRTERTTENVISIVSRKLDLLETPAQYWLAVTTIKGFLSNLLNRKALEFFIRNHTGYWHTRTG